MVENVKYANVIGLQVGVDKTTRQCLVMFELEPGTRTHFGMPSELAADLLVGLQQYLDKNVKRQ